MDTTDKENLRLTLDALIEDIVTLNGHDGYDNEDVVNFLYTLDEAKFIVSGIIYSNGMSMCDHEKNPVTGECIEDDDEE